MKEGSHISKKLTEMVYGVCITQLGVFEKGIIMRRYKFLAPSKLRKNINYIAVSMVSQPEAPVSQGVTSVVARE